MKINWQAYCDGSLSPTEMEQVKQWLSKSPEAQRELQAFESFRGAVKKAGQEELIPASLALKLKEVAHTAPKAKLPRLWPLIPIAAVAVGFTIIQNLPKAFPQPENALNFAQTPPREAKQKLSPAEAQSWISAHSRMAVPTIDLGPDAVLTKTEVAKDWASYEYTYSNSNFRLAMTSNCFSDMPPGTPVQMVNGIPIYEKEGIGWRQSGVQYYLTGGNRDQRLQLSNKIIRMLFSAPPPAQPKS